MERTIGRRRVLVGLAGASTVALAGCLGGDDSDDGGDEVADDNPEGFEVFSDEDYDLPTDPSPADFADRTGEETVEVRTAWREDRDPEFVYDPPFVRVDEGTTIEWVNGDGVFHSVTSTEELESRSPSGDFDEQIASEGATFEWTASEEGVQHYYCTPHAGFMYGSVEVV